jgi:hypothetical protein
MKTKDKLLPYPVLGNFDAVYPLLTSDAVVFPVPERDENDYIFHIELNQRNQDITKLIKEGKAEYLCEVYCKNTLLRQRYTSSEPIFDFRLGRKVVNGHVDLEFYVVLTQDIRYTNIGFNDDFAGLTFDLERGNILVAFPSAWFNAKIENEKMFALGSFVKVIGADVQDLSIDFGKNEAVYIQLPRRMYEQYENTIKPDRDFKEIIISSILHDALIRIITNYNKERDDDKTWADALKRRIEGLNEKSHKTFRLRPEDAIDIADGLLQNPYPRLFDSLIVLHQRLKMSNTQSEPNSEQ